MYSLLKEFRDWPSRYLITLPATLFLLLMPFLARTRAILAKMEMVMAIMVPRTLQLAALDINDLSTILAVYGPRNWTILAIYGARNK